MPDLSSYLLFLVASVAIILVPGPAQALVVATTLSGGQRAGALTAVGLNIGTLFHTAVAGLGLSAILATSAFTFSLVKYVGAVYLIYLGLRALRSKAPPPSVVPRPACRSGSTLIRAVIAGILNPKVALFFLAFLPQFVVPSRGPVFVQFVTLGASIALLDTLYELVLVRLVSSMRKRYQRSPRMVAWQARVSGAVMIGLGVRLAVQDR
jgi:threonine/homoserine/homoserine lactone efflux protein